MAHERDATDDTVEHGSAEAGAAGARSRGSAPTLAARPGPARAAVAAQGHGETGVAATMAQGSLVGPPSSRPSGGRTAGGATLTALDSDRYTLGSLLGQGGMGEVMLAFDEQIGREVAVKRIRPEAPSPEMVSRFVREARVQGRLEHPAIVPVHDLALDKDGKPYFVMKRLSGTTMAELLSQLRDGKVDDDSATRRRLLRAFADVCLAVEFAHSQGIIHRDLKPANVMLGDFGEVYVLDWGIARAVTEPDESGAIPTKEAGLELESGETRAGTVLGTPAYMAPEQLAGERAGPAADIYALGCMLYEIACGEVLHGGRRSLTSILSPLDARPSKVRADSPPELDAICERATRLDPGERFGSARALGARCKRSSMAIGIWRCVESSRSTTWPPRRRRWRAATTRPVGEMRCAPRGAPSRSTRPRPRLPTS